MDSNTHSTRHPAGTSSVQALVAQLQGLADQDPDRLADAALAERVQVLRTADRPPGRPVAGRTRRPRCPGGRRRRTRRPGRLHRQLAPGPAAHECRHRRQLCADRPGAVPRAVDRDRPGPGRRGASPRPMPRCWPPAPTTCPPMSPPRPNRSWWKRPAGWTRPGCDEPSPTCGWWPTLTVPRPRPNASISGGGCGCRRPGRAWSPSTGCWTPRPARPCWPPWSPWPAPPTPTMPAAVASAAPMP